MNVTVTHFPNSEGYISSKHSNPVVQKSRKQLADTYRIIRRDNPAMARLIRQRYKHVLNDLNARIWGT